MLSEEGRAVGWSALKNALNSTRFPEQKLIKTEEISNGNLAPEREGAAERFYLIHSEEGDLYSPTCISSDGPIQQSRYKNYVCLFLNRPEVVDFNFQGGKGKLFEILYSVAICRHGEKFQFFSLVRTELSNLFKQECELKYKVSRLADPARNTLTARVQEYLKTSTSFYWETPYIEELEKAVGRKLEKTTKEILLFRGEISEGLKDFLFVSPLDFKEIHEEFFSYQERCLKEDRLNFSKREGAKDRWKDSLSHSADTSKIRGAESCLDKGKTNSCAKAGKSIDRERVDTRIQERGNQAEVREQNTSGSSSENSPKTKDSFVKRLFNFFSKLN